MKNNHNVNDCYDAFLNVITKSMYENCPLRKVSKRRAQISPWITADLIRAINHKNHLYKKYMSNPTEGNRQEYVFCRNNLTNVLRKTKHTYFFNKIKENVGNMKKTWDIIILL